MKKIPLRAAAGGVCALAMMALLFARPFACIEGIRAGLTSCTQQVIPALFPFFVVSSIIAASPLAKVLGAAVWPCTRFGLGIRDSRAAAHRRPLRSPCAAKSAEAGIGSPKRTVTWLRRRSSSPWQ